MGMVQRYQKRISGPLLDGPIGDGPHHRWELTIHLGVRRVPFQKLSALESGEPSSTIRLRVEAGRAVQKERFTALDKPVRTTYGPPIVGLYVVRTVRHGVRLTIRMSCRRLGFAGQPRLARDRMVSIECGILMSTRTNDFRYAPRAVWTHIGRPGSVCRGLAIEFAQPITDWSESLDWRPDYASPCERSQWACSSQVTLMVQLLPQVTVHDSNCY